MSVEFAQVTNVLTFFAYSVFVFNYDSLEQNHTIELYSSLSYALNRTHHEIILQLLLVSASIRIDSSINKYRGRLFL